MDEDPGETTPVGEARGGYHARAGAPIPGRSPAAHDAPTTTELHRRPGCGRPGIPATDGARPLPTTPENAKIPATTYFPKELPPQYLRRWRA